jgi:seryl-tRNA synthetase
MLSSKKSEIEHLREFVDSLPDSYLRDTLRPFVPDFERGVYSDFIPSVRDSWDARIEADKEVKALRKEIAELQEERRKLVNEIARDVKRFEDGVASLREAANVVANASRWASETLSDVKGRIQ